MLKNALVVLRSVALLALAGVTTACSQQIESPGVTLAGLEPSLVCNAQRLDPTAEVTVRGKGFTPMPSNLLAEPAVLRLPSITLAMTADLAGAASRGTEVEFSGHPDGKLAGNASWDDSRTMRFRVTEEDAASGTPLVSLDPGLYDVTVTNPDGEHRAKLARGLAVVPPPVLTSVEPVPPVLCTDQSDRVVTLAGQNFLKVGDALPTVGFSPDGGTTETLTPDSASGCAPVPGTFGGVTIELCTTLQVTLPEGRLAPGAYSVVVTSPEPASCHSTEAITVVIVPPPLVTGLVPPAICIDQGDQSVTIEGGTFIRIGTEEPTVTITASDGTETVVSPDSLDGCEPIDGIDASFDAVRCTSITITVSAGTLAPGDYTVTVTNPDPAGCSSTETITLTVNAPPRVDAVVPATVCAGGSVIVIDGAGFLMGATVELRCPSGTLSSASTMASTDGTQLTATFGPGIEPGESCDVVVTNADGCEDRPLPHQTVTGTDGPILFYSDPPVVFNGVSTKITLFVTAVLPPFEVKIVPTGMTMPETVLDSTLVPGRNNRLQATVPAGQAPGDYDVIVSDDTGCSALLEHGLTVTDALTLSLDRVVPPFGEASASTPVTIFRDTAAAAPADVPFAATPRAFLNPSNPTATDVAIQLTGVSFRNGDEMQAVVPAGTPARAYDLIVVNPTGEVGLLRDAYTSLGFAPPVIDDVVPQSIVNQAGQTIDVRGSGFSGSTIELDCVDASGNPVAAPGATSTAEVCTAGACSQRATVDAGALGRGAVCVVRVVNADGTYAEFSAIGVTNSSFNLSSPTAGTSMTVARRALSSAAVKATSAARFVYAIGGDGGAGTTPFDSVEWAPVSIFGQMGQWSANAPTLATARAFAGSATIGRYVYVFGGTDGTTALASGERLLVLSPEEVPTIEDVDLCLSGGTADCFGISGIADGLGAGEYSYRVAALIDASDAQNLGGETLASDPILLKLPDLGTKSISVKVVWSAPVDSLGVPLTGVVGYRVYRTPADGVAGRDEVLLAEVTGAATLEYVDDGAAALGTAAPKPLGSTSDAQALPVMGAARNGPAGAAAPDPSTAGTWYVYALLGKDSGAATGGTALDTYEHLAVTTLPNGHQTVAAGWTAGAQTASAGRWLHGAWTADSVVSSLVTPGETFIYLGSGARGNGMTIGNVEAGRVAAGGDLGVFDQGPADFSSDRTGYGVAAAAGRLFAFGGRAPQPRANAIAAQLVAPPPALANNSWNNEGLSMTTERYLPGSSIQSAFIFLVGGETSSMAATASTETVVW